MEEEQREHCSIMASLLCERQQHIITLPALPLSPSLLLYDRHDEDATHHDTHERESDKEEKGDPMGFHVDEHINDDHSIHPIDVHDDDDENNHYDSRSETSSTDSHTPLYRFDDTPPFLYQYSTQPPSSSLATREEEYDSQPWQPFFISDLHRDNHTYSSFYDAIFTTESIRACIMVTMMFFCLFLTVMLLLLFL